MTVANGPGQPRTSESTAERDLKVAERDVAVSQSNKGCTLCLLGDSQVPIPSQNSACNISQLT